MRIVEIKYTGNLSQPVDETPTYIQIGSNIRGRRFKNHTATFEHHELERALRTGHPDAAAQLLNWLTTLEICYIKQ